MRDFPKIRLTDKQVRGISNIVIHEQGGVVGWYAEASQIYNKTIIKYGPKATGDDVRKICCSGWYAKGTSRYNAGSSNAVVNEIVRHVFCLGLPTLPTYINEHDCLPDIKYVKNNGKAIDKSARSKYICNSTKIANKMGAAYTFYCFPGGCLGALRNDPFGWTSATLRKKYGENFYTLAEAKRGANQIPLSVSKGKEKTWLKKYYGFPDDDIKVLINKAVQIEVGAADDGIVGPKTKELVPYIYPNTENTLITLLEIKLCLLGYDTKGIDGSYPGLDSGTGKAIMKFQKDNKLQMDGIAGKETVFAILNKDFCGAFMGQK